MSGREPFTVRLSTDLVSAVRVRARDEGHASVAAVVESALRLYLSSSQSSTERAALLREVEEALLDRMDKRLARAIEGLRDIAAKANFDQSLALCLLNETLYALFGKDRQAYEEIAKRARKDAAVRLRRVSAISPDAESAAVAELKQQVQQLQEHIAKLKKDKESLQNDAHDYVAERQYLERVIYWERNRFVWVRRQFEEQPRLGRRKTLEELGREYEQVEAAPQRKAFV